MAKAPYPRQSPLAAHGLDARAETDAAMSSEAGVTLAEHRFRVLVNIRGDKKAKDFVNGVRSATDVSLPMAVGATAGAPSGRLLYCLGPDEWLASVPAGVMDDLADRLRAALKDQHAAVTEVGEGFTIIAIAGPNARDVVNKGCALDLHPKSFAPGQCAQTLFVRADVLIHQTAHDKKTGASTYEVQVRRSFADYLWRWLEDAGEEYGVSVVKA